MASQVSMYGFSLGVASRCGCCRQSTVLPHSAVSPQRAVPPGGGPASTHLYFNDRHSRVWGIDGHPGWFVLLSAESRRSTFMTAAASETVPAVDDFAAEWNAWHRRQEARLADPHGFLAITSLNWLTDEPQRFPDAPGEWSTGPDGVIVDLGEGEELVIGGAPGRGGFSLGGLPPRGGVNAVWGA